MYGENSFVLNCKKKRISLPITALERKLYCHLHKTWGQYILGFLCPVSTALLPMCTLHSFWEACFSYHHMSRSCSLICLSLDCHSSGHLTCTFLTTLLGAVLLHHTSCSTLSQENTDLGTIHYYLSLLCLPYPLTKKMFISMR